MIVDFGHALNQGCYQHKDDGENLYFSLHEHDFCKKWKNVLQERMNVLQE
jgi:hypothetical protein